MSLWVGVRFPAQGDGERTSSRIGGKLGIDFFDDSVYGRRNVFDTPELYAD